MAFSFRNRLDFDSLMLKNSLINRLTITSFLVIIFFFLFPIQKAVANNQSVIKFDLKYGFIKGGEAKMIIKDTTYNGRKAIHYYMEGRTTGITDALFKVYDVYESIVDAKTHLPLKAIRNIKERNYRYYNEVFFYRNNDSIYSERTGGLKVAPNLADLVSVLFYFVHNGYIHSVEQGKLVVLPIINGHDIGEVKLKHAGIQTIDTGLGKVECYQLSPEIEKGKVLKRSDGLKIYISKRDKVPILLDTDLKVGTLRAVLSSYTVNGKPIKSF